MDGEAHRIAGLILLAAGPKQPLPRPREAYAYRGCIGRTGDGYRCCGETRGGFFCQRHEPRWVCDPPPTFTTNVYFVLAPRSGLIKIGRANDVRKRIGGLRCGSPEPLVFLRSLPADDALEVLLHASFATDRRHGEWFEPGRIQALIDGATDEEVRDFAHGRSSSYRPGAWARLLLDELGPVKR